MESGGISQWCDLGAVISCSKLFTAARLHPLANFWGGRGNVDTVSFRVLIDHAPYFILTVVGSDQPEGRG